MTKVNLENGRVARSHRSNLVQAGQNIRDLEVPVMKRATGLEVEVEEKLVDHLEAEAQKQVVIVL